MANLYPVGVSSFGDLRGRMQYVTDPATAAQVRSLILESRGVFAGGAVLSVNEGVRSRPDQAQKLAEYRRYLAGGPWAPLAASPLYTSKHDESFGEALDFGVTMPDGRNRALTMSEQGWVVARGALRGIRWTGRDFRPTPESWHFNGGFPASLAPLTGAPAKPKPDPEEEEVDMKDLSMIQRAGGKLAVVGPETGFVVEVRDEYHYRELASFWNATGTMLRTVKSGPSTFVPYPTLGNGVHYTDLSATGYDEILAAYTR